MRSFVVAIAIVSSSFAAQASAQTCVVLPVGGDAALAAARGEEALGRVRHDLEESGFTLISGAELSAASEAAHAAACDAAGCAGSLLAALSADVGIALALTSHDGVVRVAVVMVDPDGVQVSAAANGPEAAISQLTQAALSQARALWQTRGTQPSGSGASSRSSGPDLGWIVTGAIVAAAGIGVGAFGIATLTSSERCTSGCEGPPSGRMVFVPNNAAGVALTIAGAGVLAVGIVFVIVGAVSGGGSSSVALTADGVAVHF